MKQENIIAADINDEFITAQAGKWQVAADKAKAASETYLKDLEMRKTALTKQAVSYQAELSQMNAKREKLAAKVNDLSSRGKIDKAAEADAELEALDKMIATLERKLRLVNTAQLKGDAELYEAAKTAHEACEAEREPYRLTINALRNIVEAEIKRLEKVKHELFYARERDPGCYAGQAFAKVERHYQELDRKEREAEERKAAAQRGDEMKRGAYSWTLFT